MKLTKIGEYRNSKLIYRYFRDVKTKLHGYEECNWSDGKKSKRYWVNHETVGFEIYEDKKYYNI